MLMQKPFTFKYIYIIGHDNAVYFPLQQLIQQCIGGLLLNLTLEQFKEVEGKAG